LEVANDENYQFLNVLGSPGAGKSTFLRYIGWMALQRDRLGAAAQGEHAPATLPYRFNLLPVLLELRSAREASPDFEALIDDELQRGGFPVNFGRAALQAGGLLVLLDGLDEVPVDNLRGVRDLVDRYPACRYITSCRTAFYEDYFPRFADALLTDFTDDQILNFIENWFHSERDRELGVAATLWGLLKGPDHRATRELARTPLLATFLCLVYDDRQRLPANRAELYGDALRILLERWAASKRVHGEPVFPGLSTKRELLMLEAIAGPAYERDQYFFTTQELAAAIELFLQGDRDHPGEIDGSHVLEEIERKQGLLVQRGHSRYSFSHLALQEYLAACHYYKSGRSQEIASATLTQQRWREVHLLLAGLQEPDADAFLLALATETAKRVTSEPLKALLSWAGRMVNTGSSPQQTAAGRATMVGVALAHDHNLGSDLAIELALDLAGDHSLVVDFNSVIAHGVMTDEQRVRFAQAFHTLEQYYSNRGTTFKADLEEFGNALEGLETALKLPPLARQFSDSDARTCVEFLTCTQHILDCRKAAERVTQAGWDRVCARLIVT
jgi:predicted NACHT family NTPase